MIYMKKPVLKIVCICSKLYALAIRAKKARKESLFWILAVHVDPDKKDDKDRHRQISYLYNIQF